MCGAFFKGLFSLSMRPCAMARASSRTASIASQKRSSSRFVRLGGLHHQRPRDGPAHGRRVKAAIDEPLGDVVDGDASLLEWIGEMIFQTGIRSWRVSPKKNHGF